MHELLVSRGVKPRKGKIINCSVCKGEFYKSPSISQKFCSYKCYGFFQRKRVIKICSFCKKKFERPQSTFYWKKKRGHLSSCCSKDCSIKLTSQRRLGSVVSKLWTMRKADRVFSEFIRQRDGWVCRHCGKDFSQRPINLHCSHFWSRRYYSTRYDPKNCIALCAGCHIFGLEKEKQGIYRQMMIDLLGEEEYKKLEEKSKQSMQLRDAILEFMEFVKPYLSQLAQINKNTGRRNLEWKEFNQPDAYHEDSNAPNTKKGFEDIHMGG